MSPLRVAWAGAGCGVLAVAAAAVEAPPRLWGVVVLGLAGAVAVLWRPVRVLAVLAALAALGLSSAGPSLPGALLVGVLLVGFALVTDLTDSLDVHDLAVVVAADEQPDGTHGQQPSRTDGTEVTLGWVRCAGALWLAGVVVAGVVAVAARVSTPVAAMVAVAPLAAVLAALVAIGRRAA